MRRILSSLIVALVATSVLSACVLSSKVPKLASENTAAPIATDAEFDAYSNDGQGWRKEDTVISFKRDGDVYLMSDGKSMASALFVALDPDWFAVQYREGAGTYFYGLAKKAAGELEVMPLSCEKLKAFAASEPGLVFAGEDCTIDGIADAKAFFARLIDKLPGPEMKLVPRR